MHPSRAKVPDSIIIFFLGLAVCLMGLQGEEVVGFDSRLYAFGLEMWRHGFSWFPRTFAQYYPDYPVTSTVLMYFFSKLFHTFNKSIAILPSAIAASLTLVVTYLIGAVHHRKWGWYAVIFSFFTMGFIIEARAIAFDFYVTFITALSFYIVYTSTLFSYSFRIAWLVPLFVLGFSFRGPIGLIIPAGVVCFFYLIEKDLKKFIMMGAISFVLLLLCTSLLLMLAYYSGGINFYHEVLHTEIVGRILDAKSNPFYFYFIESIGAYAVTYPLMLLMLPGVILLFTKGDPWTAETKFLLHLLGWIIVIMVGLSIPDDKKVRYILSITPALALFCGYLFSVELSVPYLAWVKKVFLWFCFFFPGICLLLFLYSQDRLSFHYLNFFGFMALLVVIQVIMFLSFISNKRAILSILFLAMTTFIVSYIFIAEATDIKANAAREFVLQAETLRTQKKVPIVFYREGWDGLAVKYFINLPTEEKLFFVSTAAQLSQYHEPAIFISSIEYVKALPVEIASQFRQIMQGKIGHDTVILFEKA